MERHQVDIVMHKDVADFRTVLEREHAIIKAQRNVRASRGAKGFEPGIYSGISISGGGIRSASFSMGVLQALAAHELLEKVDYLSTVSGGGYTGSSLTWFNHLARDCRHWFFPFGRVEEGARDKNPSFPSQILGYIRQHGNYLVPGSGINLTSIFMTVLRNMLLPMAVYLSLMVTMFIGFIKLQQHLGPGFGLDGLPPRMLSLPAWLSAAAMFAFVVLSITYAWFTWASPANSTANYRFRIHSQVTMGLLGGSAALFALMSALPLIISIVGSTVSASGGIVGIASGLWHFYRDSRGLSNRGSSMNLVFIVTAALLIYALLAVAYLIADASLGWWPLYLGVGTMLGFFVNLNYFGLGRMYRDRLIETFLPNRKTVETGRWAAATEANTTLLHETCTEKDQGPFHLVNCNLVLIDAEVTRFRGRGGDNFTMTSAYCGSDATGWVETEQFNHGNMTLATAMAISGAAANPHTGANGEGPTRNRFVSFLMFMLGLRLGYYVVNPASRFRIPMLQPNYLYPGIYQGLLGQGFNTRRRYLELTDGGHFENTAMYELIRRRLDLVIAIEAGADPTFAFADLANLVEKVRVDFGVYIRFDDDYGLAPIIPGSSTDQSGFAERYDLSKRCFAIGHIWYPPIGDEPASEGLLVFIKATMTTGLPADLYGYKGAHPTFPNQTTADQFFDEMQLESYRELGFQLADDMLKDPAVDAALSRTKQMPGAR